MPNDDYTDRTTPRNTVAEGFALARRIATALDRLTDAIRRPESGPSFMNGGPIDRLVVAVERIATAAERAYPPPPPPRTFKPGDTL